MKVKSVLFCLTINAFLILSACGGNGGGGGSSSDGTQPTTTTGTIDSSGGSIQTSKGTTITIPEGVLPSNTTFTIKESSESLPLTSDFKPVSDTVEITGSEFIQAITVKIPYSKNSVTNSNALVVADYDSDKAKWEMCTIVNKDMTNANITIKTSHFSKFKVLQVVSEILKAEKGFDPITDIFPVFNTQENFEYTQASNGACFGISAFTKWYCIKKKNTFGPLVSAFDKQDAIGIGVAAQNSMYNSWMDILNGIISAVSYISSPAETGHSVIAGLKLTGNPQILALKIAGTRFDWRHAVLAYYWEKPYLYVYNPNYDPYTSFMGMEKLKFDGTNFYTEGYPFYTTKDGINFDGFLHIPGVLGNNTDFENIFNRYSGQDKNNYASYTGTWSGTFHETYGTYKGESGTITVSLTVPPNGSFTATGTTSSTLFKSLTITGDINNDTLTGNFKNSTGSLTGVFKTTVKDAYTLTGTYSYYYSGTPCGGSITFRKN